MKRRLARVALASTASWILPAVPAALFIPTQAHAQTVCSGVPVDLISCLDGVTATATGTVNAGSVVLAGPGLNASSATDLIINLTGQITTTGNNEPGVLLTAVDDLIFTMDGTVETLGDNSDGVNLTGASVTADLGDVLTHGINAQGVQVLSTEGPTTVTVNEVQTDGDDSDAILITGVGDINLDATLLSTGGMDAAAINIESDPAACVLIGAGGCDVTAAAENVTTDGFGGIGALIAAAGDTTVTIGVLQTNGDQAAGLSLSADPTVCAILGEGACDTAFTVGSLTTNGADSPGALVRGAGDIDATVDVLQTNGDNAIGLDLASDPAACIILGAGACETSFTVGQLTTQGAGATGALVRAAGPVTGDVGILETNGDDAAGIVIEGDPTACVIVGVGTCDVGLTADQVTTNGNQAAAVIIDTVGDITTDLGLISTNGDDSPGVLLSVDPTACLAIGPGSCVISHSSGDVDTDGDNSPGTVVDGGEDPIDVEVGDTNTDGDNSPGIVVTGTGPIDVTAGDTTTNGDDSPGIVVNGDDDPVTLTCGNVETFGINSPGVDIDSNGAITVTCESVTTHGDNSDGIQVTGDTGPVAVTVGQVTTEGADSDGIDVTTTTGDQTIVTGGVNVSGPGSDGISAVATGCADISITATGEIFSSDGTAIYANTLCGVTVVTEAGAPVTGADAGIDVTSGTGTTITLGDRVTATDGPAINVDGAAALITVNAGGSIVGAVDLTDEDDTLNNGGTFDVIGTRDFGAGVDVINNAGIVRSVNGDGVLANCETFNNSGTVTMVDNAANDSLSICGDYVGTGDATLAIDVDGATSGLTADQLIIAGNASGSTGIDLNQLPGGRVVDTEGVLVVDAGSVTGTPFTLNGPTQAGFINYALDQRGSDTFLISTPDEAIFDLATLAQFGSQSWYQSGDAHLSCAAARRNDFGLAGRSALSVCGQAYYADDRSGEDDRTATVFGTVLDFSDRLDTKRWGVQLDLGYRPTEALEFGLTGGYEHAEADLSAGSDLEAEGYNIGAYAEYGMATGLYAGLLVKYDNVELRFDNPVIDEQVRPKLKSTGVDGEIGWRTPAMGATLDLNAGLSYVHSTMDDYDAGFISFEDGRINSLRGRIGARMTWAGSLGPFIDAKLLHEFEGDSDTIVGSGALIDRIEGVGRGTWGRIEAGLAGGPGGDPLLSAWADVGDVTGWGVRAGYRFGGSAAPAPPPVFAAPAPPPEAPATQTCADGTVILASEMCPAPPPPPPPPPPAPERG